eukprot:1146219-Amphidinium_carterae.2
MLSRSSTGHYNAQMRIIYAIVEIHQGYNPLQGQVRTKVEHNKKRVRSRCQLSRVQTQIGLDAIQRGRAPVGQSQCVWEVPLLHISRTQSAVALSSAEAEPYAMGQATDRETAHQAGH